MPMASPVHHTSQLEPKWPAATAPEKTRLAVPREALIVVAAVPAASKVRASLGRASSVRNWSRRSSHTATTGAAVLPTAMPAAATGDGLIGTLTANAAKARAGHKR